MARLEVRVAIFGAFIAMAAPLSAEAATATSTASDGSDCEIDQIMHNNRVGMDENAIAILDGQVTLPTEQVIDSAPSVKDSVCIDDIGVLLGGTLPTFGDLFGGIMDKLKKAACSAANGFLKGLASRARIDVSDPFGIVKVGVGATTNGQSGIQTSTYDLGSVVENAATSAVQSKANEARNSVNRLPTSNPNRLPNANNEVGGAIKDAIKGL